jgi:hypothetical protein
MDGQLVVGRVVVVNRQPQLLEIIAAAHPTSCFPGCLHCWQQQPHQNANNGNDHQKLHQSETFRLNAKTLHDNIS